jgi:UDP-glucose:(heptosyl)LPS alpha-1,3-glucosyltransferase
LHLDVYGKEDPRKYSELAGDLEISDSVHFHGTTSDPREAYRRADFFILPTHHDPCSLVVLEALVMGLPVISTRFNGACEIMTNGEHGLVLSDPNDIDALAETMKKMLDPQLRFHMSTACLELRPRLSYEHHVDRLIQIYEQCAIKE